MWVLKNRRGTDLLEKEANGVGWLFFHRNRSAIIKENTNYPRQCRFWYSKKDKILAFMTAC